MTAPIITKNYLRENKDTIFVFGDNLIRKGYGGAAALRDEENTYGFITKKYPNNYLESCYNVEEYKKLFLVEITKLKSLVDKSVGKTFFISKIGSGLANKFGIFEKVIEPNMKKLLSEYKNVIFLW